MLEARASVSSSSNTAEEDAFADAMLKRDKNRYAPGLVGCNGRGAKRGKGEIGLSAAADVEGNLKGCKRSPLGVAAGVSAGCPDRC